VVDRVRAGLEMPTLRNAWVRKG